jgi:hypothetical protein
MKIKPAGMSNEKATVNNLMPIVYLLFHPTD